MIAHGRAAGQQEVFPLGEELDQCIQRETVVFTQGGFPCHKGASLGGAQDQLGDCIGLRRYKGRQQIQAAEVSAEGTYFADDFPVAIDITGVEAHQAVVSASAYVDVGGGACR